MWSEKSQKKGGKEPFDRPHNNKISCLVASFYSRSQHLHTEHRGRQTALIPDLFLPKPEGEMGTGSPLSIHMAFKAPTDVMFSCPCARVKAFHARPIWKTSLKSCSSVSKQEAPLRPYKPINPGLTSPFPVMGSWARREQTHKHAHLPCQSHATNSQKTNLSL